MRPGDGRHKEPTMAIFSWFSRKPAAKSAPLPDSSSGLSRQDPTRPVRPAGARARPASEPAPGQPANRKAERLARRELLYGVVRESMVRAGVLSASYKFKVLALDQRGRQFLVMMDLASQFGGETDRLAEIEAMIAQAAKARHDILVTAVYWRINETVATGRPGALATHHHGHSQPAPLSASHPATPAAATSRPAPLMPPVSQPAPLDVEFSKTMPLHRSVDPLQDDEVEAFKRALAAGASIKQAVAATTPPAAKAPHHGPQSYTLLTGYEDTEMSDPDEPPAALSATQYGELR